MNIQLEIENLAELQQLYKQAPALAASEIQKGIKKAAAVLLNATVKEEPIDTGKLRQSTHADIKQDEATIEILKPAVDYAIYVHNGSPAVNGKLMAIEAAAISPRARAKLPPPNKKGMIFFTKRKAIPPNPFMERAVEKSRERVMSIFEDVAKRIAAGMATK